MTGGFSAAWQKVRCADCGREYTCAPEDDYYHRPDVMDAGTQTLENGVCTVCLVGPLGLRRTKVVEL